MKTIGILGGLGPQATDDFLVRVHAVAQQALSQQFNSGYPPLIVYYVNHPPFVMDATGHPTTMPPQPHPGLLAAARTLGRSADFLVITANGPHLVAASVE